MCAEKTIVVTTKTKTTVTAMRPFMGRVLENRITDRVCPQHNTIQSQWRLESTTTMG